jgi:hypothetical protein
MSIQILSFGPVIVLFFALAEGVMGILFCFQGYKVAFIVFRSPKSIEKASNLADNGQEILLLSTDEALVETGLSGLLFKKNSEKSDISFYSFRSFLFCIFFIN